MKIFKIIIRIFMWIFIVVFSLVLVISVLNFVPFTISEVKGVNQFRKTDKYPLVIPHGGAKDLYPENTIYAYDQLIDVFDADVLEIDLSLTKDNILISHHNLDLEMSPLSELHHALIRDYTYDEIVEAYHVDDYYGARTFTKYDGTKPYAQGTALGDDMTVMEKMIPVKIEDIFASVGDSVFYILEIKDSPTSENYDPNIHDFEIAAQQLIDLVKAYQLEDEVILASFSDDVTAFFKAQLPNIKVNAGTKEVTQWAIFSAFHIDFFWSIQSEVLILPNPSSMSISGSTADLLDKVPAIFRDSIALKQPDGSYSANFMHSQMINDAHRKNMAVYFWTIDDPEEMRLLINLGVDGIITDRPDLLRSIITQMQAE